MAIALDTKLLNSRAAAEAYVGGVCFKVGPPELIGAELEWLTVCDDGDCSRPSSSTLAVALGSYAPKTIASSAPARPLPGGSFVTVEPGGQIEISSAPFSSAEQLCRSLSADAAYLRSLLAAHSIATVDHAADAHRPPRRILLSSRYCAMEDVFGAVGSFGTQMMCNTAATQVSVDAGADEKDIAARWSALNAIGPALLAAFACSPNLHGAPAGSWASQRMRAWLQLDPSRTSVPVTDADPIAGYARWALDVPLLCVVGRPGTNWAAPAGATFGAWIDGSLDEEIGRRPTRQDLDYHLTTLFPPVRAAGHLEVRYIDAQPGDLWQVPIAVFDALMSAPEVVAQATDIAAATAHRWWDAAEFGLADAELRSTAVALLDLAAERVVWPEGKSLLSDAAQRCRTGRPPTKEEQG
ncbi:ergothioneine biosynthesis glutamate--cysteine ligase EgtA [Antrihabitans sp. YC2-6]|uniref:ergothioneine biosynthesis glutamate--cysteine ligase EgtA n=1 Tax=Antrihabitans sp. YC2-6 TaxID=2799498 RepID=UPI0018F59D30|nr:ergothioneine biosynthesis glutamate--cysteine ligase EgtA [Antrihabitans sp. YC2-6]MBJ8344018.1 ergothioneine biosynthesis glutamate--cysteine ligase EgtA [Antrihabitans sp. YC2-6]